MISARRALSVNCVSSAPAELAGARAPGEACYAHFSLKAVATAARPRGVALRGHFFGFAFFTADFLAPFFALLPRSRTLLAREELESPAAPSPALRRSSEFPLPGRLLKYWSGSRVEADRRRARSERGASPQGAEIR